MCQEKEGERRLVSIEDCKDTTVQRLKIYGINIKEKEIAAITDSNTCRINVRTAKQQTRPQKIKMQRKTIWIFQATNYGNCS